MLYILCFNSNFYTLDISSGLFTSQFLCVGFPSVKIPGHAVLGGLCKYTSKVLLISRPQHVDNTSIATVRE